jgi:hypothetical protein
VTKKTQQCWRFDNQRRHLYRRCRHRDDSHYHGRGQDQQRQRLCD